MSALLWLLFGIGRGPLPDMSEPPRLPYFLAYDGTGDAIIVDGDEITIHDNHFFVSIGGYLYPASDKQFARFIQDHGGRQ